MADWGSGIGLSSYQQTLQNELEAGQRERDRQIAGEHYRREAEWEERKRESEARKQREAILIRQNEAKLDKRDRDKKTEETLQVWARSDKKWSERDFSQDKTAEQRK